MTSLTREQDSELRAAIYLNRGDPGLRAMKQLLEHRLEKAKERLLECQPEEFPAVQAEARAVGSLLRLFSDPRSDRLQTA